VDTYNPENHSEQPEENHESSQMPYADDSAQAIAPDQEDFYEGVSPPLTPRSIPPIEEHYERPAYEYEDYEDSYQAPLEPINPWIGIITQPRETIRYILESGKWNNIWAIYAVIFLISIPNMLVGLFMQPAPPDLSQGPEQLGYFFGMGFMLIVMLVIGYPLGMLMVYIFGSLLRITGGWLDGVGTSVELRITLVWAYMVSLYMSIIMLIPYGLIAFHNHTNSDYDPAKQMMISLIIMLVSVPSMFIMIFYGSNCIGEAHQFSAWRGLGTILLTGLISMVFWIVLWIGIMVLIVELIAAFSAMG